MLKEADISQPRFESGLKKGKKSRSALSSGPQYEFVTSVGAPTNTSTTAASKQVVKKHAMRSFLRQRDVKLINGGSKNAELPRNYPSQAPISGKFKLDSWSRKSSKRKSRTDEVEEIAATAQQTNEELTSIQPDLGPFELLNISLIPEVRRLLHYCMNIFLCHDQ
jgi:hypothetical protein